MVDVASTVPPYFYFYILLLLQLRQKTKLDCRERKREEIMLRHYAERSVFLCAFMLHVHMLINVNSAG